MSPIFSEYSVIFIAAAIIVVALVIVIIRKPHWQDLLAVGVIAAGLFVAWLALHPTQTPLMDDAKMVQAMIGKGKPVLLEFQSPY